MDHVPAAQIAKSKVKMNALESTRGDHLLLISTQLLSRTTWNPDIQLRNIRGCNGTSISDGGVNGNDDIPKMRVAALESNSVGRCESNDGTVCLSHAEARVCEVGVGETETGFELRGDFILDDGLIVDVDALGEVDLRIVVFQVVDVNEGTGGV